MADELSVLLVSKGEPDLKLFEQLEKKELAVEISALEEFSNLLALVEPQLVIHSGSAGAEETVRILKEAEEVRRIRLVIVAPRDDLLDLRKLDKTVVVSLLADDIAPAVVAARVVMLAKKGPEKSLRPPSRMPSPATSPGLGPSGSKSTSSLPPIKTSTSSLPPSDKRASSLPPGERKSPAPAPLSPRPAPSPAPVAKTAPLTPAPRPVMSQSPVVPPRPLSQKAAIPRAVSQKPTTTVKGVGTPPPPRASAAAPPAAAPSPAAVASPPAAAPKAAPAPAAAAAPPATPPRAGEQAKAPPALAPLPPGEFGFDQESAEELTVAMDAPVPLAARPSAARVLVADTDVTRADFIATALREAGIEALIVPLDAAETHWALVRAFRPTILLGDGTSFKSTGQVWLQLFQADHALRSAKFVNVPFDRIFDLGTGKVNLRTLIPQIPQLSGDMPSDQKPTRGPTPLPAAGSPAEPPKPQPAPVAPPPPSDDDDDDDAYERMTVAHSVEVPQEARSSLLPPQANNNAGILEDRSRRASIADIEDLEVLESAPGTAPPPGYELGVPESVPHQHTSRTAPTLAEGNRASTGQAFPETEQRSSGVVKIVLLLLVLLVGGAATWLALGHDIAGFRLPSMKPASRSAAAPAPPPKAASLPEPAPAPRAAAPAEEAVPDPLWMIPAVAPVKKCDELVTNLEELKPGGVQQANISWSRARQKLVLGDLDQAQVLMCEAVLLHPESLAVEGLASLYVARRQGEEALVWIDRAIALRADRIKTLEVQADVYSILGRVEDAKKTLAASLKVDPGDQKTLDAVAQRTADDGDFSQRSGAMDQAELFYRRAATLSPTNAKAAAGMATVHAAAGSTQGAQLWAEKTLGLDDGNPAALVVQAALAAEGGEADRAAELCKRALKRDPAYAPAHQLLKKLEGPKEASTKPEKPAGQPEEPAKEPEAPAEQPEEPAEEPEAPAEEPQ